MISPDPWEARLLRASQDLLALGDGRRRSGLRVMRARYLVVHDYGMGGLWGYVLADSADQIKARFPELDVVEERPAWMQQDLDDDLRAREEDIESPDSGILSIILEARASRRSDKG